MTVGEMRTYNTSVRENVHGHRTKLLFFLKKIEQFCEAKGIERTQIKILDVGCGNGIAVTLPIGQHGYPITGIDFHKDSITYARKINTLGNVTFQQCDAASFSNGEKFNVILYSDVLEHIHAPGKLLSQIKRNLKQDGIILISIPNGYGPFEIENFLLSIWPFKLITTAIHFIRRLRKRIKPAADKKNIVPEDIPYHHECGHVQFFSMKAFKKLVYSSGFMITGFEKCLFLGGIFSSLFLARIPILMRLNISIGKHLPYFMGSVWYFECKICNK